MDTIGGRIEWIIRREGLKKVQFAAKLGIHQSYVTQLIKGKNPPSEALVKLICREFHIREEWLLRGEGEADAPAPEDDLSRALKEYGLPAELRGLFLRVSRLPEDMQVKLREIVREWALEIAAEEIRVAESASNVPDETEEERLERETREEAEEYYRLRLEERKAIRDSEAKQAGTPRNSDSYGDTGGVA